MNLKRQSISISDKRLSSFFISLILSLFFYLYLLFPNLFCFNFVVSEWKRAHSLTCRPTYLGRTFSSLFDISEWNVFSMWGVHVLLVHSPAYAPELKYEGIQQNVAPTTTTTNPLIPLLINLHIGRIYSEEKPRK